ncbi:hypothetical protein I3843_07G037600 [Carya illinoinensis]|nr:hypothetical protein I3843_07G037600 [Carya illinoinensis]
MLGFIEIDVPFWDGSAVRDLFFRFKQRGRAVKMVGSCNGLVCVTLYNHKDFYIWNPSTGAQRKLPDPEVSPDGGTYKYGFGYDSSSGDYKVLVASYGARNPGHFLGSEGKLFSLKRNSWIRIQVLDNPYESYYSAGILCNGALHWEVVLDEPYKCQMIIAFNLAEEKFINVPYPSIPIEEYDEEEEVIDICFDGLRNLGGRLCFTCYRPNFVELLVMMEYGVQQSWERMFKVVCDDPFGLFMNLFALWSSSAGQFVGIYKRQELMRKFFEEETHETFVFCRHPDGWEAVVFAESLLSPNDYDLDDV